MNQGYITTSGFYDIPVLPSAWRREQNLRESRGKMAIKDISNIRRIPRLGCIRLGIKTKTQKGVEYPKEVDYFILDPNTPSEEENQRLIDQFHKLYGKEPKQIKIMFPLDDPERYFPQHYKRYGKGTSLKCIGDGEEATCTEKDFAKGLKEVGVTEQGLPRVECKGREWMYGPESKKECSAVGVLQVLLPELEGMGTWQITTGSFHSIVNLNSCIDYITTVCGRAHMLPLKLERRPQETTHKGQKAIHYTLHLNMDFKLADIQKQALIPPSKILLEAPETEAITDAEIALEVDKEPGEIPMTEQEKQDTFIDGLKQDEKENPTVPEEKKTKPFKLEADGEKEDFFEFMMEARKELNELTGDHKLYQNELKLYNVKVLSDVKDDLTKQNEIRIYFKALLEDTRKLNKK
jgi:hypothetical protein